MIVGQKRYVLVYAALWLLILATHFVLFVFFILIMTDRDLYVAE